MSVSWPRGDSGRRTGALSVSPIQSCSGAVVPGLHLKCLLMGRGSCCLHRLANSGRGSQSFRIQKIEDTAGTGRAWSFGGSFTGLPAGKSFLTPITEACLAQGVPHSHPAPFPASCFGARVPGEPAAWQAGGSAVSELNLRGFSTSASPGGGGVIWVPLPSLPTLESLSEWVSWAEPRAHADAQGGLFLP